MSYIEESVSTRDGLRLYVRRREVPDARGEVVIVHGLGEHCGRYAELTECLVGNGYSVTAYDHRGHGQSEGLRGHVDHFSGYEEDLDLIVSALRKRSSVDSLFLIGHSMGGLVALRYLANKASGFAGAVISAPLIRVAVPVPSHKVAMARIGSRLAPRFRLDNEINTAHLSRDPEVGRAYAADPLVNRLISLRWFSEAGRAMHEIVELAPRITVPLLVMHGTEDKLASVEGTKSLFGRIGSTDKELVIYEGFYHELFNEPERQQIFARAIEWVKQRD